MAVRNFDIKEIEARRFTRPGERFSQINVNFNVSITNISPAGENTVNVDFRFTVNYTGIGVMRMEGSILYEGNVTDITERWGKKKAMPDHMANEIHAVILNNCVTEAFILSRDLHMPPPLPVPQPNFGKKSPPKSSGVEVM